MNGLTPQYLVDPIPMPRRHLFGRHVTNDIYCFSYRNDRFLYSFYPDAVNSWNALDADVRKTETLSGFKKIIMKSIQPKKRSVFNVHDENGIRGPPHTSPRHFPTEPDRSEMSEIVGKVGNCRKLSEIVGKCRKLSENVGKCRKMSEFLELP